MDAAFATLPSDDTVRDKTLVVLQAPNDFTSYYFTLMRSGDALPLPEHTRVLSTGLHPMTIERPGANRLVLRTTDGFIAQRDLSIYRNHKYPMQTGETISITGMTAVVTKADIHGWPMDAVFTFDKSLDDESILWYIGTMAPERNPKTGRKLKVERYFPVPVPAVGETLSIDDLLARSEKYKMAVAAAEAPG